MAHLDQQGGAARFGSVGLVVTTITALAAIAVALWLGGSLNRLICGGDCGAAAVRTPDSLHVDPAVLNADDAVVAPGAPTGEASDAAIRSAVDGLLAKKDDLGDRVGFAAVDPTTGDVLDSSGPVALIPASTTKLLTALTALTKLDPQQRFTTSVVRAGDHIVLVGGGDPYLGSEPPKKKMFGEEADIETLAARTAKALRAAGVGSVRLDYNASRFTGPSFNPAWEHSYRTENVVTPITALWVDQGVVHGVRSDDPAASAAEAFAHALSDDGISVSGDHSAVAVPPGATPVANVRSATLARIAEQMIATSDNEAAEVLLRQAAIGAGRPGSFSAGVSTVQEVLRSYGIETPGLVLNDGSGLSRHNRIAPVTLAQVIAKAAAQPRTASLVGDLPVARFSGSMARRFSKAKDGRGVVRAKTGTLKNVHSFAGVVTDRLGTPIVFAVMADHAEDIPDPTVEAALDDVPAALARCTCSTRTVEQ